jgi:hypothetical protein
MKHDYKKCMMFDEIKTHTYTKHEACKCIEKNQHCPRDAVVWPGSIINHNRCTYPNMDYI